jgi:hypothetical protein
VAGGGGPGSTPATQVEIAVIVLVLEPRREMVRAVGVGGRNSDGRVLEVGGWARKSYDGLEKT